MDPQESKPPTKSGPVEWFERISLLGDDIRKIGKTSIVPALVVSMLFPALVDQLSHPELLVYQIAARTFPLTTTIAVIWISTNIWNVSKRMNGFWLIVIWCVSLYLSIDLALRYGCDHCGKLEDIHDLTYSWLPKPANQAGVYHVAFLISAAIYFFNIYGWQSFLASLVCGSFLGLAGIYLLRPGGPLDRTGKTE